MTPTPTLRGPRSRRPTPCVPARTCSFSSDGSWPSTRRCSRSSGRNIAKRATAQSDEKYRAVQSISRGPGGSVEGIADRPDPPPADHWRRHEPVSAGALSHRVQSGLGSRARGRGAPDDAIDRLATGENEEGGNAHRVESCGDRGSLIDVYPDDLEPPSELRGELVHCRPYRPAGSSPGGAQIDQYGKRRHGGHGVERRMHRLRQPAKGEERGSGQTPLVRRHPGGTNVDDPIRGQ
jgi:hypothetical protein